MATAKRRAYQAEYMRAWRATDAGKAAKARYKASARGKVSQARYDNGIDGYVPPPSSVCDICGNAPKKRYLQLDHDHSTARFRGWLCNRCNLGLGIAKDNVELLGRWITYLQRPLS